MLLEELFIYCGVNRVGREGIEGLKTVFGYLRGLKRVRLDYIENSLGNANVQAVVEMFSNLQNVEEFDLNLNFNNLLEKGVT